MIGIDQAHASLIYGLVVAFKPTNILECGYGGGVSHHAIMAGADFNKNKPHYTLVDNWHDWNFQKPRDVLTATQTHGRGDTLESFTVVTSDEKDFIDNALSKPNRYDFIMMDADHQHSHEWAMRVYDDLLTSPGILIYHDVDGSYPGLGMLPGAFDQYDKRAHSLVFNKSTRDDEECKRGLLVVFKP